MNQNQKMKAITMGEAVVMAGNPEAAVYMMIRVGGGTTVDELALADGFFVPEEEKEEKAAPKKAAKQVDHGRIVALYTADPPRTVGWIANDMGVSDQTVINHLKKEGIYDPGRKVSS